MMILSGAKAHLWQRVSAVYLFFYFPFSLAYLSQFHFTDYELFRSVVLNPYFILPTLLGLALLMTHVWIGARDVMIDYVPRKWLMIKLVGFGMFWLLIVLDLVYLFIILAQRSLTIGG